MGYSQKRDGHERRARYRAVLPRSSGAIRRSAGTFSSKKDADKAWQQAETTLG